MSENNEKKIGNPNMVFPLNNLVYTLLVYGKRSPHDKLINVISCLFFVFL